MSEVWTQLARKLSTLGDIWQVDELFITIQGQRHYLWRAVDQDGDVIDILGRVVQIEKMRKDSLAKP